MSSSITATSTLRTRAPAFPADGDARPEVDLWDPEVAAATHARVAARLAALEDAPDEDAPERQLWFRPPVIDHTPTVTLLDEYGGEAPVTQPLLEDKRWLPNYVVKAKNERWHGWLGQHDAAIFAATVRSIARSLQAVVEQHDKETKPKKAGRPPKADETDEQKQKREAGIEFRKAQSSAIVMRRARTAERLQEFDHDRLIPIADRTYKPFTNSYRDGTGIGTALRSQLGIRSLALYHSRLPKGALYGLDKRSVSDGSDVQPLFLRDYAYLTISWWKCRGQLSIDLDGYWDTLADLRRDLIEKIGVDLLPSIIVYRLDAQGRIEKPHLLWILPPGSEVGIGGKSRGAPMRLHSMVQQALVSALIDLGGDCGHLNTGKTKNPLSEYWSLACLENFPDLGDFMAKLPKVNTDIKEMRRRQNKVRGKTDGEEDSESNLKFKAVNDSVNLIITEAFRIRDQEFLSALKPESSTAYGVWLKARLIPAVRMALCIAPGTEIPDDVAQMLHKAIRWRCRHRPNPNSRYYNGDNRGRDVLVHEAEGHVGAQTVEARKEQGTARKKDAGTITRANQGADSRRIVSEQIGLFARIYGDVADDEAVAQFIIRSGKLSKSTVYKWLPVCIAPFRDASRYIATPEYGINQTASPAVDTLPAPVVEAPAHVDHVHPVVSPAGPAIVASGHRVEPVGPEPSSQSSVCRRAAEPPVTGGPAGTSTCPSRPSTWLHWDGRRVVLESTGLLHADHSTVQ